MEGRYATALFSAASKQNKLDQMEQELGKVSVSLRVAVVLCNFKGKKNENNMYLPFSNVAAKIIILLFIEHYI